MSFKETPTFNLYSERSSFKWIVLAVSVVISASSIVYTSQLVQKIRDRESKQIALYAKTLEYLTNDGELSNAVFILEEIVDANNTIPVIVADEYGEADYYKNLPAADAIKDSTRRRDFLYAEIQRMREEHEPILVTLSDNGQIYGYKTIYYKNSLLLTQLKYYPYIQLSVIAIFALITFAVFNYSRTAEQNRVWVGMAKETAHQLGTPLSSLLAWTEYFKEQFPEHQDIFLELEKDVDRLEMITERFSNIGSVPQLREENVPEVINEVVKYLQKRISRKVVMEIEAFPSDEILGALNKPLFAWVIENIIKNAVDAMGGVGRINIKIMKVNEGQVSIDIADTGKGIAKNRIKQVFQPGFTTKKRGWGLGLTLTKRIVENYHGGKIFVKSSEVDKGTTFRILLKT
ncbi:sensor histidine kinase [Marinoscillum sp.]|uniref:sensor histidine kinase n=1 Tax=Marinoscillum sp. TaxID=2024838 RepID=UPI003BAD0298